MDWMTGVSFPAGAGIFLFATMSILALGPTKFPVHWVLGLLSLGVKWSGHEADRSLLN
jgi:hypothetical protein